MTTWAMLAVGLLIGWSIHFLVHRRGSPAKKIGVDHHHGQRSVDSISARIEREQRYRWPSGEYRRAGRNRLLSPDTAMMSGQLPMSRQAG